MITESPFQRLVSLETSLISLLDASASLLHERASVSPVNSDVMRLIIITKNLAESLRITRQAEAAVANETE